MLQKLRSRLRSSSAFPSFMRMAMNPQHDHFVREWIDPYLDEDGYAILELSGKIRYFCYVDGELKTAWDISELVDLYGIDETKLKKYTFIPSKLSDNKKLIENNPDYEATLEASNKAEKAAMLDGCWNKVQDGSQFWKREWVKGSNDLRVAPCLPNNVVARVRGFDKAGTDYNPSTSSGKYCDFTASVGLAKTSNGFYYIFGNFVDNFIDKDAKDAVLGKCRKTAGARDELIKEQLLSDGPDIIAALPQDVGQAGLAEFSSSARALIEVGITVRKDPNPHTRSKLLRFQPFAAACELGFVYIVENSFTPKSLEAFYKELENFDGERSKAGRGKTDDWVDSAATAFAVISRESTIPSFSLGQISEPNQTLQSLRASISTD